MKGNANDDHSLSAASGRLSRYPVPNARKTGFDQSLDADNHVIDWIIHNLVNGWNDTYETITYDGPRVLAA